MNLTGVSFFIDMVKIANFYCQFDLEASFFLL